MAKTPIHKTEHFIWFKKRGPLIGAIFAVFVFILDFANIRIDVFTRTNRPPQIEDGIHLSRNVVPVGETINAMVIVDDPDSDDQLNYFWGSAVGTIQLDRFGGAKVTYIAPAQPGVDVITVMVYDREGESNRDFICVTITESEETNSP